MQTPQGPVPAIGIPNTQDYPRLVFTAPYHDTVPLAELLDPAVQESVEGMLPALLPPYVDGAAQAAVQQSAVLLTGSTMSGPLNLNPLMPTADHMAASKAYVDSMIATAGVPEVPTVPIGQSWVRQVGQWVPLIDDPGGPFLALSGGVMQGQINMSGNAITNLPAIPVFPNGAAPAQWVLNQIASVSLYQGVWNLDTMTPDLTQASTHINGYTWIAVTTNAAGIVIGPAVPGLQGMRVFNGDTVIFSATQGQFGAIHAGGLTAPQADALYVKLAGSQMSGALLLSANATQPTQAVTLQQLTAFVPPGMISEAPADGQVYARNGVTHGWTPALSLAGGVMTGLVSLSGNASSNLNPVPLQQMTAAISTELSGYVPLAGGVTMTGLLTLSGNAGSNLNPVPLQQVNAMLGSYVAKGGDTMSGNLTAPQFNATTAYQINGVKLIDQDNTYHTIYDKSARQNIILGGTVSQINFYRQAQHQFENVGGGIQWMVVRDVNILMQSSYVQINALPAGSNPLRMNVNNGENAYMVQAVNSTRTWATGPFNTGQFVISDVTAAATRLLINVDGTCGNTTGTWSAISDANLKENIGDYTKGLPEIRNLLVRTFNYVHDPATPHFGLVAQEVEPYLPELIGEMRHPIGTPPELDEAGNPIPATEPEPERPMVKTVDPGRLIFSMLNAVKELAARVETLEARP